MDYNKTTLIGRLGKDPEMRATPGGLQIASFSLATNSKKKDQKVTHWHNIVCFGKQAEAAQKFLSKGSLALVEGELTYESWEKDGVKRQSTKILANHVLGLDKKEAPSALSQIDDAFAPSKDDFAEIPF